MKNYGMLFGGWFDNRSYFVSNNRSWFGRGGYANDGARGIFFEFYRSDGNAIAYASFRIVLTKE